MFSTIKEKAVGMFRYLKTKLIAFKNWVVSLKKHMTVKTLSWAVPALIIVVGLVVLVTVPANDDKDTRSADEASNTNGVSNVLASVVGMYESGPMPAASTPGREFTLALAEDGTASFVGDYKTGRLVDEVGTWVRADNRLTVTIQKRFGFELEEPTTYVFTVADGTLSLVEYEFSRWGYMGLTLTKKQ